MTFGRWNSALRRLGFKTKRSMSQRRRSIQRHSNLHVEALEARRLLVSDSLAVEVNGQPATDFYTVDGSREFVFQYDAAGNKVDSFGIPRTASSTGIAASGDGSTAWVLKSNEFVYVFDTDSGSQRGRWDAVGPRIGTGITTDGTDVWIVDAWRNRVYRYEDAASATDGRHTASETFRLNLRNRAPTGLATDGTHLFVSDSRRDRVFVYDFSGSLLREWQLDRRNRRASGIAVDSDSGDVWVTDLQDRVAYVYPAAAATQSGSLTATRIVSLASGNRRPEGIARPGQSTDTTGPALRAGLANDTGRSATDGMTTDAGISGSATDESSIAKLTIALPEISGAEFFDITSIINPADGSFTLEQTALEAVLGRSLVDGGYTIRLTATDEFNNVSSVEFPLVLDTQIDVTAIAGFELDTGASNSDGVTNDTTPTFFGTAEAGSLVKLVEASLNVAMATADGTGNWTMDVPALADGTFTFKAFAEDAAGNVSDLSNDLIIKIDSQAPSAPVIVSFDDDTGVIGDGITADRELVFHGTAEPDSTVTLSGASLGILGSTTADGSGNWTVDATSTTLADGAYLFTAAATDLAGNSGPDSSPLAVTVISAPLAAPTITAFDTDTGASSDDGITNDTTLQISGTSNAGNTITLSESSLGVVGSSTANGQGEWTVDLSATQLSDGSYQFSATASDGVDTSPASNILAVQIDTVAESPDIFGASTDTGIFNTDQVTSDTTLLFSGSADRSSFVTLSEATLGVVGSATATSLGIWQIDISSTVLADGDYEFTATSLDLAGNVSPVSDIHEVTVDTTAPDPPVVENFEIDPVTGIQMFSGTAEPSSRVTLFADSLGEIATSFITSSAQWSVSLPTNPLPDGQYTITATVEDIAGNVSALSAEFLITVDTSMLAAPTIDGFFSNTGDFSDNITNDTTPSLFGNAEAGSTVTLSEATLGVVGTRVATFGSWFISVSTPLADGTYVFIATADDGSGTPSPPSDPFEIIIDTTPPVAPIFDLDPLSDTGTIGDQQTGLGIVTLIGTTEPGAEVRLNGVAGSTTVADANGDFAFADLILTLGVNSFTVIAEDIAANESQFSLDITKLQVGTDVTPPVVQIALLNDNGFDNTDLLTNDTTFVGTITDESAMITATLFAELTSIREFQDFSPAQRISGTTDVLANINPDGSFTLDEDTIEDALGSSLYNGDLRIELTVQDASGNVTVLEAEAFLDVEFVAPTLIGVSDDSGLRGTDRVTNDATLIFDGTADPDSQVTLTEPTLGINLSATPGPFGTWVIDNTSQSLADGSYTFTVLAADGAGNSETIEFDVTIDTSAPSAPTFDLAAGFDTGTLGDLETELPVVSLTGTTTANVRVELLETGQFGSSDALGEFTFEQVQLAVGTNSLTIRAVDLAGNNSELNQTITRISTGNTAPVLDTIFNQAVRQNGELSLTLSATDFDEPANGLMFSLDAGSPAEASITANGEFTFDPTPATAPGAYAVTVNVADDGSPSLSDSQTFTVFVRDADAPLAVPVLDPIGDQTIALGRSLAIRAAAYDFDATPGELTFEIVGAPAGLQLDPTTGVLTWKPTELQLGDHAVTVRVSDANGLVDTEQITLTVGNGSRPRFLGADTNNQATSFFSNEFPGYSGNEFILFQSSPTEIDFTLNFTDADGAESLKIELGPGVVLDDSVQMETTFDAATGITSVHFFGPLDGPTSLRPPVQSGGTAQLTAGATAAAAASGGGDGLAFNNGAGAANLDIVVTDGDGNQRKFTISQTPAETFFPFDDSGGDGCADEGQPYHAVNDLVRFDDLRTKNTNIRANDRLIRSFSTNKEPTFKFTQPKYGRVIEAQGTLFYQPFDRFKEIGGDVFTYSLVTELEPFDQECNSGIKSFESNTATVILSFNNTIVVDEPDDTQPADDTDIKIGGGGGGGGEDGPNCDCEAEPNPNDPRNQNSSGQSGSSQTTFNLGGGVNGTNSSQSNPHPIIGLTIALPSDQPVPELLTAQLNLAGIVASPVTFDPSGLVPGDEFRISLLADATSLPTGRHPWTVDISLDYGTSTETLTFSGHQEIVNSTSTELGNRWTIDALDYLVVQSDGVMLVFGDTTTHWFELDVQSGEFQSPEDDFRRELRLVQNLDSSYTLSSKIGERWEFNPEGLVVARLDRNGNATTLSYIDADGDQRVDELAQMTDPVGRTTQFSYDAGLLTAITDFSGRTTSLQYSEGLLRSIVWPDPDGTGPRPPLTVLFGYDPGTNLMTSMTDVTGEVTSYQYDEALRLIRIVDRDGSQRLRLDSTQSQNLSDAFPGLGTPASPLPLLPTTGALFAGSQGADR